MRISRLCLLASAGLAEVRPQFISNVEQTQQVDGTVPIDSAIIGEHDIPREVLDFMNLIVESYNPIQHLPIYREDQLQHLNMPVLFIDGENDVIIDAGRSAQRLASLVPSSEIHLLTNCGHVLTNSIEYILPFLTRAHRS
jgi:pimeloyl-ACP methyl ester carboxylesterase